MPSPPPFAKPVIACSACVSSRSTSANASASSAGCSPASGSRGRSRGTREQEERREGRRNGPEEEEEGVAAGRRDQALAPPAREAPDPRGQGLGRAGGLR